MPVDRLAFFAVALAYLALPGHAMAPLPGLPLDVTALAAALGLCVWAAALPGAPPRVRVLVGALLFLAVARLALAWLSPPYGLTAEYRTGAATGPVERSTEWLGLDGTRVERAIAFEGAEFRAHFFNDVDRFNFFTANQPRRDLLQFGARWRGQFWAEDAGR